MLAFTDTLMCEFKNLKSLHTLYNMIKNAFKNETS